MHRKVRMQPWGCWCPGRARCQGLTLETFTSRLREHLPQRNSGVKHCVGFKHINGDGFSSLLSVLRRYQRLQNWTRVKSSTTLVCRLRSGCYKRRYHYCTFNCRSTSRAEVGRSLFLSKPTHTILSPILKCSPSMPFTGVFCP